MLTVPHILSLTIKPNAVRFDVGFIVINWYDIFVERRIFKASIDKSCRPLQRKEERV